MGLLILSFSVFFLSPSPSFFSFASFFSFLSPFYSSFFFSSTFGSLAAGMKGTRLGD
jgi:hypothetical protein